MNIHQEKLLAKMLWIILLLLLATSISTLILLTILPQETTQKQHNFPVGDDTEHTWVGGNGESFEE
jgi:hypothetical protein